MEGFAAVCKRRCHELLAVTLLYTLHKDGSDFSHTLKSCVHISPSLQLFSCMRGAFWGLTVITGLTAAGIYWIHHQQVIEREVPFCCCRSAWSARGERTQVQQKYQVNSVSKRPCCLQNLHKGVLRDKELYELKKAQQKLLQLQQQAQPSQPTAAASTQ